MHSLTDCKWLLTGGVKSIAKAGLKRGRWPPGNYRLPWKSAYSANIWQVIAGGCWQGNCFQRGGAASQISLQLIWLLAGCHDHQWFAWKLPTCLQTHANYWLSGNETVKITNGEYSSSEQQLCNVCCSDEAQTVTLQFPVVPSLRCTFQSFTTAWRVNGECLQTSQHLPCKHFLCNRFFSGCLEVAD